MSQTHTHSAPGWGGDTWGTSTDLRRERGVRPGPRHSHQSRQDRGLGWGPEGTQSPPEWTLVLGQAPPQGSALSASSGVAPLSSLCPDVPSSALLVEGQVCGDCRVFHALFPLVKKPCRCDTFTQNKAARERLSDMHQQSFVCPSAPCHGLCWSGVWPQGGAASEGWSGRQALPFLHSAKSHRSVVNVG